MKRHGFTLLELMVVIIIIGILGTMGLMQYGAVIERGRRAEARSNLGTLRTLQNAYEQDYGVYGDLDALMGAGLPDSNANCNASYYYWYSCETVAGSCSAARCSDASGAGRDAVPAADVYTITLTQVGVWSEV